MHRCSIYCIVPPVVFERIAKNGSPEQREWAVETVSRDTSLRAARIQNMALRGPGGIRADALASAVPGQPKRTIYDAKNQEQVTGEVVRAEGGPGTDDVTANEAPPTRRMTASGRLTSSGTRSTRATRSTTPDYLSTRSSTFGDKYDNAFWDGQRMVFGDGDGELFNRFTIAIDVIGHELAHGVVETTAKLNYWQQPGALNESCADVFGSLVKQRKENQTAEKADWLIGAGLLTDSVSGPEGRPAALRSMAAPGTAYDDDLLGKDSQPAHMDDFVQTTQDNGGVHINSGIPNKAFHTVATTLGGYAWEEAGAIWYSALRDPQVQPTARFQTFARATARAAVRKYGTDSKQADAVAAGWEGVGVSL